MAVRRPANAPTMPTKSRVTRTTINATLTVGWFHSTRDDPGRVNPDNLILVIKALERYIEGYNSR